MNISALKQFLAANGQPAFREKQISKAIFQDALESFDDITTISKDLREALKKEMDILPFDVQQVLIAKNKDPIKALLKLKDGNLLETVLISPKEGTWSACISCQVGCPMGCRFCATGEMGLKRNLTAEEITDQILFWKQYLKKRNIVGNFSNIVYMGMGEPFANWENVKESLQILIDPNIFGFGSRSISVSTSGLTEGIANLANEFPQVSLALSLHFSNDEKRNEYMPVNRKDSMESLREALRCYLQKTNRKVFIEYVMLDGLNDGKEDAVELAQYLKSIGYAYLLHVNLIRYNVAGGNFRPSSKETTLQFKENLQRLGINATIRKSLGDEIKGACGQLAGR